jgi:tRNA (guanine37-N1)-methyltransferase
MSLRIDLRSLFPEMFQPILGTSIPKRAAEKGLVEYHLTNLRDFATDAHRSVDDRPFGGGPGMVMMCEPMFDAVDAIERQDPRPATRVILTPGGKTFDQRVAEDLARRERLLLIAGHYEGFDDRIIEGLRPMEISLGDYILTGGELAAMVVIDAVIRLLPGALGHEQGAEEESFSREGLLEQPQYTRPREFRGMAVPDVLLSGNHGAIAAWKLAQRRKITQDRRPDLWQAYATTNEEQLRREAEKAAAKARRLQLKQDKEQQRSPKPGDSHAEPTP